MRVFRQLGKKSQLEWRIWVDDEDVHMESGVVDGRMKHTSDHPGPVGKFGTLGYKDARTQAILVADRRIRSKCERLGYVEVDPVTGESLNEHNNILIFSNPPKNLRFMKCRHQPEPGSNEEKEMLGVTNPIYTIKRDGMMHPIFIDENGNVEIYTRRMDRCTEKYPYIAAEVKKLRLPHETILMTEFVMEEGIRDNRVKLQTIDRSLADRAVKLQSNPFYRPKAIILGIPYWDGNPIMSEMPVHEWINFIYRRFGFQRHQYLRLIETMTGKLSDLQQMVLSDGLEGLVIYDGDATFDLDDVMNFRGREERPRAWKWKPIMEGDFLVVFAPEGRGFWASGRTCGSYGSGRLQALPGSVALFQYGKSGTRHYICNCGSGFTEEQRAEILARAKLQDGLVGVATIKYESRTFSSINKNGIWVLNRGSDALTAPIFVEWRPDKKYDEAIDLRLP